VEHKAYSTNHVFMCLKKGLFFSDFEGEVAHVLINTVNENKKNKNKTHETLG